ncbi:MAG: hypothetical protein A3K65_00205 [Euryarchaeota archaeon RBG_16_68_12]|nr:MAG: hypothetical protein A3K65_00205 [Euryarchaeota archaeon RBG_16_68_12]
MRWIRLWGTWTPSRARTSSSPQAPIPYRSWYRTTRSTSSGDDGVGFGPGRRGTGSTPVSLYRRYSSFTHRRSTFWAQAIRETGAPFSISRMIHLTFFSSSFAIPLPRRGSVGSEFRITHGFAGRQRHMDRFP